jgi:hypothetical protein
LIPTMPKPFTHMTVIPFRRPLQKAHTNLGHAKAAISYKTGWRGAESDMELYELKDGEWSLLWKVPEGTAYNDLPWKKKDK